MAGFVRVTGPMRISGSFDTRQTPHDVYLHLTDPRWVVEALDFPSPSSASADECVVQGDVGIGPLRGNMEIHVRIVEREQDRRAVYAGSGTGLGSSLTLRASFELAPGDNGGTHVDWAGDAEISGPLGPVASGVFQPLSRRNFEHLMRSLDTE